MSLTVQALVVQRLDNAIHQLNRYSVDKCCRKQTMLSSGYITINPVDSDIQLLNNPGQL